MVKQVRNVINAVLQYAKVNAQFVTSNGVMQNVLYESRFTNGPINLKHKTL